MTLPDRILSRFTKDPNGCLIWQGATSRGYGKARYEGKLWQVHRLVWTATHGPVPDHLVMDHICRNRACANVDHLRVVTNAENLRAPGSLWCGNRVRAS